jgi:hypothetical protein
MRAHRMPTMLGRGKSKHHSGESEVRGQTCNTSPSYAREREKKKDQE